MKKFIIPALLLAPSLAFAQSLSNLSTLLDSFGNLVEKALPIVVAIALLAFFWGLVKYIFTDAKEKGTQLMLWGIVALFVMVSVWGLVKFVGNAFGVSQDTTVPLPTVPGI